MELIWVFVKNFDLIWKKFSLKKKTVKKNLNLHTQTKLVLAPFIIKMFSTKLMKHRSEKMGEKLRVFKLDMIPIIF